MHKFTFVFTQQYQFESQLCLWIIELNGHFCHWTACFYLLMDN